MGREESLYTLVEPELLVDIMEGVKRMTLKGTCCGDYRRRWQKRR